jgi:hypothetical protein
MWYRADVVHACGPVWCRRMWCRVVQGGAVWCRTRVEQGMVQNEVQGVMQGEYGAGECGAVWCRARVVQGTMQNEVQVVQDEYGAGLV